MNLVLVRRIIGIGFQVAASTFVALHWLLQSATWESIRFSQREGHYGPNDGEIVLLLSLLVLAAVAVCELVITLAYVVTAIRTRTTHNVVQLAIAGTLLLSCLYLLVTAPWK